MTCRFKWLCDTQRQHTGRYGRNDGARVKELPNTHKAPYCSPHAHDTVSLKLRYVMRKLSQRKVVGLLRNTYLVLCTVFYWLQVIHSSTRPFTRRAQAVDGIYFDARTLRESTVRDSPVHLLSVCPELHRQPRAVLQHKRRVSAAKHGAKHCGIGLQMHRMQSLAALRTPCDVTRFVFGARTAISWRSLYTTSRAASKGKPQPIQTAESCRAN